MVEIIVVISLVFILALILVGTLGGIRKSSLRVQDAAQLRQIGVALNLYLTDNNRYLPVCWVGVPINPIIAEKNRFQPLSAHLAEYLGHYAERGTRVFVEEFQSPAWGVQYSREEALGLSGWHSTYRLVLGAMGHPNPFGGVSSAQPMHVEEALRRYSRCEPTFPVLFNLDSGTGTRVNVGHPEEPFFKNGRNVLFLDGSVQFHENKDFLTGMR